MLYPGWVLLQVSQAQNDNVTRFIQVTFVMLPFTCAVLSFCLKFYYPIKHNDIAKTVHQGIKKFKSGCKRVYDPILNEVCTAQLVSAQAHDVEE